MWKSHECNPFMLSYAIAHHSKPVAVRLEHYEVRKRVDVQLLLVSPIEQWFDSLLEPAFNDFAPIIDDAYKAYAAVKLDNSVAETQLLYA
jgi:hypothetical protein